MGERSIEENRQEDLESHQTVMQMDLSKGEREKKMNGSQLDCQVLQERFGKATEGSSRQSPASP